MAGTDAYRWRARAYDRVIEPARRRFGEAADLRLAHGPTIPFGDGCADLVVLSLPLHSVEREKHTAGGNITVSVLARA